MERFPRHTPFRFSRVLETGRSTEESYLSILVADIKYLTGAYGYLLNTTEYRDKEVSIAEFKNVIASNYDLSNPRNKYYVDLLDQLIHLESIKLYTLRDKHGDVVLGYRNIEADNAVFAYFMESASKTFEELPVGGSVWSTFQASGESAKYEIIRTA
jgi:hypothetical protein